MTDPNIPQPSVPPAPAAYAPTAYGAAAGKTNTLAIVGFILSFFISIAGIIVSFIALNQIKKTGEGGHGLALAGVIIGFVGLVIGIIYIIAAIALVSTGVGTSLSN